MTYRTELVTKLRAYKDHNDGEGPCLVLLLKSEIDRLVNDLEFAEWSHTMLEHWDKELPHKLREKL
jgi:hypothetical protein